MQTCKACGREWPADALVCPDDGAALSLPSQEESLLEPDAVPVVGLPTIDLARGTMVGEFRVEWKLGQGGMASVFAAIHPVIEKRAAIKVLSHALSADRVVVERFVREARAVNQIRHPNIVDIFAFGRLLDGRSYFVMEWLEGQTLAERLIAKPMTLAEIIDILDQICDAVEGAHRRQIVHRDLKPDNVFLQRTSDGQDHVKLLDFGIAKLLGEEAPVRATLENAVMGTPHYLSPEQARGRAVDARTDIYSLGVTAYEMVVGKPPFDADNTADIIQMHLCQAVTPPRLLLPAISPALDRLLMQMLQKEADKRPTLQQIRASLAELGQSLRTASGNENATTIMQATPRRRAARLGVIAASALMGIAAVALIAQGWGKRSGAKTVGPEPGPSRARPSATDAPQGTLLPRPGAPAAHTPPPPNEPPTPPSSTLVVRVNVLNARIDLDGRVVAQGAAGTRVERLDPGAHTVRIDAPGHRPFRKTVAIGAGVVMELPVTLESASTAKSGAKPEKIPADRDYVLDPFR